MKFTKISAVLMVGALIAVHANSPPLSAANEFKANITIADVGALAAPAPTPIAEALEASDITTGDIPELIATALVGPAPPALANEMTSIAIARHDGMETANPAITALRSRQHDDMATSTAARLNLDGSALGTNRHVLASDKEVSRSASTRGWQVLAINTHTAQVAAKTAGGISEARLL